MEVSAKQEGAKRFDDPGIAAALAGDTDVDGPAGGLLPGAVKCGKLEPKVPLFVSILHSVQCRSSYPLCPSKRVKSRPFHP